MLKFAFKDVSTKNSEPTYWTVLFVMLKNYFIYKVAGKKIQKGYIKFNYVVCLSDTCSSCHVTVMGSLIVLVNKSWLKCARFLYKIHVTLQCIVVSALRKTSKVNTILKVVIFKHSVILFRCIVTVCVFVRHLFSFYPFYFDFHSARIIFDVSSGFYLCNINKTTEWHL